MHIYVPTSVCCKTDMWRYLSAAFRSVDAMAKKGGPAARLSDCKLGKQLICRCFSGHGPATDNGKRAEVVGNVQTLLPYWRKRNPTLTSLLTFKASRTRGVNGGRDAYRYKTPSTYHRKHVPSHAPNTKGKCRFVTLVRGAHVHQLVRYGMH